jgi:hypothetical protein
MNEAGLYAFLEKRFLSTFLDELLPGIFHNFANPLNGIMGRSKLLQRRLEDFARKIERRYPEIDTETSADCQKLISDINVINDESEKFFDMFRAATGKFYSLTARDVENLNLSALINAELGFADFYLDHKHNVRKEIRLDMDVPAVTGITAYYSIAFWMLIREASKKAREQNEEPFRITTVWDDRWVIVKMSHIGDSLTGGRREPMSHTSGDADPATYQTDGERNLTCALALLRLAGAPMETGKDEDSNVLTIRIQYRQ